MIKRLSIICALSLYLDFVNMFLYLLRLFGGRN
jgi:FtsH-binding integral membrane protein